MGLIKAAIGAIGGTFKDQWKEAIRCEDLGNDILMKKVTTPTGVITNKSTIIVGPGQCAVIYDNGRILDASAEEGVFTFDSSSSPSFFAGQFGAVFKEMWERFTYNGATSKQQAVFYFNIKEIINNPFGTKTPVLFQDWAHPILNEMTGKLMPLSLKIKCFGKYTFKIENPAVFMSEIAGTTDVYRKAQLIEQMQSEVLDAFQNLLNQLGTEKYQIPAMELTSQTDEIKEMMANTTFDEPIRRRGIQLIGFAVEGVSPDEESDKKINDYEINANAHMQRTRIIDVMGQAASNANGAANGFMGLGFMNMQTGGMVGNATQGVAQGAFSQDALANSRVNENTVMPNQPVNQSAPAEAQAPVQEPAPAPTQEPAPVVTPEQVATTNEATTVENAPAEEPAIVEEAPAENAQASGPKFCPECGTKLAPGSKFCPECGKKL
ncbi:MAG: SPFH domain-containing protein [Clostridia bacterium]|nr:SPFH domain-containing protein [Clostridia bacterium]